MLPGAANISVNIKKSNKKDRAQQISEIMNNSDYDIIVFQEAFHNPARKILQRELKNQFPYQYFPIENGAFKTSSGIFIVSKIELNELGSIQYDDCNGIDCWARKGASIFEGSYQGKTFQIIGTHLDAEEQSTREKQYKQAYEEILKPHEKEGVPQFFCGDFNTRKSQPERYDLMLSTYNATDIETKSKRKNTTIKDNAVIDYILLRKNNSSMKVIDKKIKTFKSKTETIDKLGGTLSDHLAVEVTIKL